jgi:DNA-directed RNA polymerase subunit RPC12/RpoP
MADTYTCANCKEVFEKAWSDEEALEESKEKFGEYPQEQMEIVCDGCYKKCLANEKKYYDNLPS